MNDANDAGAGDRPAARLPMRLAGSIREEARGLKPLAPVIAHEAAQSMDLGRFGDLVRKMRREDPAAPNVAIVRRAWRRFEAEKAALDR